MSRKSVSPSHPLVAVFSAALALLATAGCASSLDPLIVAAPDAPAGDLHTAADPVSAPGEEAWGSFTGAFLGSPAMAVTPQGDIEVFTQGEDNALWTRRYDRRAGVWREWQSLGGVLTSAPAVAAGRDGRLDVFVRGTDNALWTRSRQGVWGEWQSLGGALTSHPSAVSAVPGRVDVVVRGTDSALWHRAFDRGAWTDWESLGGVLTSAPSIASWGHDRLDVFARGTDGSLWHRFRDGSLLPEINAENPPVPVWSDWQRRGGVLWSEPAAASLRRGHIDVAARGTDNALWVLRHDGRWGEWRSTGAKLYSAVSVLPLDSASLLFFGASADNTFTLHHAPGSPESARRLPSATLLPGPG